MDSVLARVHYLYPDSLPNRRLLKNWVEIFTPEMSVGRFFYPRIGFDYGVNTFNLKGDTLCHFYFGIDSIGTIKSDNFYNFTLFHTSYLYDNKPTFSATYCDTILPTAGSADHCSGLCHLGQIQGTGKLCD